MDGQDHRSHRVADELAAREPIFHRSEFGSTRADFEPMLSDDFWEVGASGRRYCRDTVLQLLDERSRRPRAEHLAVSEFQCRRIAVNHYLVTYRLDHDGRHSRRATIWRYTRQGWQAIYYQGTLIGSEDDSSGAEDKPRYVQFS